MDRYTDEELEMMVDELIEDGLLDDLIALHDELEEEDSDDCDCMTLEDMLDFINEDDCEEYDVVEDKENVNEAFKMIADGLKYYYNPEKQVFTIVNPGNPNDKAVVKKHKEDEEDMEKAMLYCLLKFIGIKPSTLFKIMEKVQIQQKAGA